MENTNIKQWYMNAFPTDELGEELNENVRFNDVIVALDNYKDVYDLLGVYDSIVRERVFEKLSNIMNVDYDYIYKQWLKGA
jgi:hypothetical protein